MLTHIKLENFKIWSSTGPVKLAPLTLFLGTNSSGKSSLIQSLLLIRQTVNGNDPALDLNLGNPDTGDSVTLGQFKDVLCRHGVATEATPANQVGIEFRWRGAGHSDDSVLFSARYRKGNEGSAELDFLRLGKGRQSFIVQRKRPGIYSLSLADKARIQGSGPEFRPERSFSLSAATLSKLGAAADIVRPVGPALLEELARIIYLGPVRRLAQRDYVWSGRMPQHIGDDGSKAIDALIASGVECQSAGRKHDKSPTVDQSLFNQTVRWLKTMNLAYGLHVRRLGKSARHELLIEQNGEQINVRDVGVGVSQVLPVIVAALFAKPGHVVMIEEPESHLHPLAQSVLAELFSSVSRDRHVQFIIETHSEHLFRRLQTLVAKGETTPEDTAMYFVERDGKSARLRVLEMDESGRVSNWPEHFFGDALGETRQQLELSIKRAREMREKSDKIPD